MTEPATPATPAVFIHGLWLHATSWGPWLDLFREAGYEPVAPGWPHEPDTVAAAREQPELVANTSIDEAVEHYATIIAGLGAPPVIDRSLVRWADHREAARPGHRRRRRGHRPGADQGRAAAAARPAAGRRSLRSATLRTCTGPSPSPAESSGTASATPSRSEESDALHDQWTIPSPARPLFQAAAANFALHSEAKVDTANETRGPLLLISGTKDHTVPDVVTRSTFKQYRDSDGGHRAAPVRGTRALAHGGQRLEGRGRRRARLAEGAGPVTGRVRSWT